MLFCEIAFPSREYESQDLELQISCLDELFSKRLGLCCPNSGRFWKIEPVPFWYQTGLPVKIVFWEFVL